MTDDVIVFPIPQDGTYRVDFNFALMSAEQWREYFVIGRPSWCTPFKRLRWEAANLDLRMKLRGQGVRL